MAELADKLDGSGKGGRLGVLVIVLAIASTAVLEVSNVSVVQAITNVVLDLDTMIVEAADSI